MYPEHIDDIEMTMDHIDRWSDEKCQRKIEEL